MYNLCLAEDLAFFTPPSTIFQFICLSVSVFEVLAARYCDIVKESNHIPGNQHASGHNGTRLGDKVVEVGVR
jgi:hypothetical protein